MRKTTYPLPLKSQTGAWQTEDRIIFVWPNACSCVTCPKCGIWVVIRPQNQLALSK
jgi:hypothetical protein